MYDVENVIDVVGNDTKENNNNDLDHDNIEPNVEVNDNVETHNYVVVNDDNDVEKCNNDDKEVKQMKAFENQLIEDREKYADDPTELKMVERTFNKKLVNILPQTSSSNKVSSVLWKYCKEIKLTEYAESLYKKGKN